MRPWLSSIPGHQAFAPSRNLSCSGAFWLTLRLLVNDLTARLARVLQFAFFVPDGVASSLGRCPFLYLSNLHMPDRFPIPNRYITTAALCVAAITLAGCAVRLPPAPAANPADPHAPEAATVPLRPTLLASSRTYLSLRADDREQEAKQMGASKMKMRTMADDMAGTSNQGHDMGSTQSETVQAAAPSGGAYFTCPMHPEIHQSKPGQCPECGMTLVKQSGATEGGNR